MIQIYDQADSPQAAEDKISQLEHEPDERVQQIREQYDNFQAAVDRISQQMREQNDNLQAAKATISQLEHERDERVKQMSDQKDRLQAAEATISQLEHERDERVKQMSEQIDRLQAAEATISQLEHERDERVKQMSEQIDRLQAAEATISQLEHERDERVKQMSEQKDRLQAAEATISQLEHERDERVKQMSEQIDRLQAAEVRISQLEHERDERVQQMREQTDNLQASEATISQLENEREEAVKQMSEQIDRLQAAEVRILQLEHERDEGAKKRDKGDEADEISCKAMISKAIQTAPMISAEKPKIVSNTTGELTPVHPSAVTLVTYKKGKAQYIVNYKGKKTRMTRKEFREKVPEKKPPTYTEESKARKSLRNRIRRLISQRFRDQKNDNKIRSSINLGRTTGKPPPITELRKTQTIENLIIFFLKEYMEKGEDGLPVKMDGDPEKTDDEYEEKVIEAYRRKPKDYELLLKKSIRSENSRQRKRKNSGEEATEKNNRKSPRQQTKRKIPQEEAAENKKRKGPSQAGEKGNESETLSSAVTKSSKNFFTKDPEVVPVRPRNKRTATVVRPNQPMEENIPASSPPVRLRNKRTATVVRPNEPTEENIPDFNPPENSRPTVETPLPDNNWVTDFEDHFPDPDKFSSLDYSTLTEGQNRIREQVKTPETNNNWIKEEEYPVENVNFFDYSTPTPPGDKK